MFTNFGQYAEEKYMEMAMKGLSNVALFNDARFVGLYDADKMRLALEEKNNWQDMMKSILGAASFRRNYGYHANESTGIAAQHGYGPLLYLLLMHRSPNGLIPNRVPKEMNEDAKKVWQQFAEGAGRDLVVTEPLNVKHHPETYLNLRFRLKRPLPGIAEAERRNEQVIGLDQYGQKRAKIAKVLETYLGWELGRVYPEVAEILAF